jgi:hypothetical protein
MRIIYDNLIDSLTSGSIIASSQATNYPITNIQDQRLSIKYISSSSTTQSITITLPTFPEIPNNSAGTFFNTSLSTDFANWTAGNGTISLVNDKIRLSASTASPYLGKAITFNPSIYNNVVANFTRISGTGTTIEVNVYNPGINRVTSLSVFSSSKVNSTNVFDLSAITTTITSVYFVVIDGSATDIWDFAFCYIGTGLYDSQITDISNNTNTSVLCTGVTPSKGPKNKALFFNGHSCHFDLSTEKIISSSGSVSFWYKSKYNVNQVLASTNSGSAYYLFILSTGNFQFCLDNDSTYAIASGINYILFDDSWHFYTFNFSSSGATFTRDNIIKYTNSTDYSNNTWHYQYFGYYKSGSNTWLKGSIYDFRIYSRVLSDIEKNNLYQLKSFSMENFGLEYRMEIDSYLDVDTIAILGHNFLSGTKINIQAILGDTNENLVINDNVILKFISSEINNVWKLSFSGQGSIEIGRLWIGKYLTIDPSSLIDFSVTKKRSDNVVHGKNRQKFASIGIGWRKFNLSFPPSNEAMLYLINKLYDSVGNHSSFIFCNFDTIRDYCLVEPCYVSIAEEIDFNHGNRDNFSYELIMEEEK